MGRCIYIVYQSKHNTIYGVLGNLVFKVEILLSIFVFLPFKYVWYNNSMFAAGILIVSDKGSRGERKDESGVVVREFVGKIPAREVEYAIVADEKDLIASELRKWVDDKRLDIIFTSGGTGLSPRDITPEATLSIADKVVPGLAEAMRMGTMKKTEEAILSRAVVGIRGKCLIINLPGSPRGVRECMEVIMPVLPHALDIVSGRVLEHSHRMS
jgi:molybdenum cofactor synthesis domain-containing protein